MEALIAILAGGRGTRLGGAKPTVELAGRPLISYPYEAATATGRDLVIAAKPGTALPELGRPVLTEPAEPAHPLCGIVAALRSGDGRPVVALACDMPFVTAELLDWIASLPDSLVMPRVDNEWQPLIGRFGPAALEALEAALEGRRSMRATVADLGARPIGEEELARFGDPGRLLFNVNTPADLEAAERLLAGGHG